jgi:adenosylhomocysteine nucleosidase
MERTKIGFVVGLRAEAALLRGFLVGVGGGTPEGAAAAAGRLVDEGANGLVSFGLSGGLRPLVAAGAVLVPDVVVEDSGRYVCDSGLVEWLGGRTCGLIAAMRGVVVTAADKAALYERTQAEAVDLESGAVGRVAAERGVGFAVLRAVCDTAEKNLPEAALVALDAAGGIGIFRVLGSVIRKPSQLPGLVGLARDAGLARRALAERVRGLK